MIDQMADYIKGRTTVTSRFEEVEYLEPPTITLCMHPLFKPTKMAASGLTDQNDVLFTDFTNDTLDDRLEFFGYLLGRDYEIEMALDETGYLWKNLLVGSKNFDNRSYEIQPIQTLAYGTCYKIQPSFMIFSDFWQMLRVPLNPSLKKADNRKSIFNSIETN